MLQRPAAQGRHAQHGLRRRCCLLAVAIALAGLAALIVQALIKGAPRAQPRPVHQRAPRRFRPNAGLQPAIIGTLWLIACVILFIVPLGVGAGDLPRGVRRQRELVEPADRGQHPEPRGGAVDHLRHPRPRLHRPRRRSTSASSCSTGVAHPGAAGPADRDPGRPRGAARGAALDPRGLAGARRDQVADDPPPGPAGGDPRDRDRRDPRALAGDRRDGAADPVGAAAFVTFDPERPVRAGYTALPVQIFNWHQQPQEEFQVLAAAGIIVLLALLLAMNSFAICAAQQIRAEVVGALTCERG